MWFLHKKIIQINSEKQWSHTYLQTVERKSFDEINKK